MPNFLQYIHLLEHFPSRVVILHVAFVNSLNSHVLTSQFVDT